MQRRELVARLEPYGVPALEAAVYYELCRHGPAKAADAARLADVARSDVYRLLDSLVELGFVEKTLERPARYAPVPVHEALDHVMGARRRNLARLEQVKRDVVEAWPRPVAAPDDQRRFSVVQGTAQIRGLLDRMIAHAQEEILVVATLRGLARLSPRSLMARLGARKADGVRVRFLTRAMPTDLDELQHLDGIAQVRHADLGEYHQMFVIDGREAALFVGGTPGKDAEGKEDTLLWVTSPPFVLAQCALVDQVWQQAVPLEQQHRRLRDGDEPDRGQVLRGRFMRFERLKGMAHKARRLRLLAPAQEVARWHRVGFLRALERAARNGTDIEIATDLELELPGIRVRFVEHVDEVVVFSESAVLEVDGWEHGGTGLTYEEEYAHWSTFAKRREAAARRYIDAVHRLEVAQ